VAKPNGAGTSPGATKPTESVEPKASPRTSPEPVTGPVVMSVGSKSSARKLDKTLIGLAKQTPSALPPLRASTPAPGPARTQREPAPVPAKKETAPVRAQQETAPVQRKREPAPQQTRQQPAPQQTRQQPAPQQTRQQPAPVQTQQEVAPAPSKREPSLVILSRQLVNAVSSPRPVSRLRPPAPPPTSSRPAPRQAERKRRSADPTDYMIQTASAYAQPAQERAPAHDASWEADLAQFSDGKKRSVAVFLAICAVSIGLAVLAIRWG